MSSKESGEGRAECECDSKFCWSWERALLELSERSGLGVLKREERAWLSRYGNLKIADVKGS